MDVPLAVTVCWWWLVGNRKAAGSTKRAVLGSTFISLTSFIARLRILLFVAGSWCSEESEQWPLLQSLLSYCNVLSSISYILFFDAQLSSLGCQNIDWSDVCALSVNFVNLGWGYPWKWDTSGGLCQFFPSRWYSYCPSGWLLVNRWSEADWHPWSSASLAPAQLCCFCSSISDLRESVV